MWLCLTFGKKTASSGPIQDLDVPRDREGKIHTQAFDRYNRYEAQVAEGLTEMFVAGVSTQKVGDVAQTLMGVTPSASTVSRLHQTLTQQFETWRERPLQGHWRIVLTMLPPLPILWWRQITSNRQSGRKTTGS